MVKLCVHVMMRRHTGCVTVATVDSWLMYVTISFTILLVILANSLTGVTEFFGSVLGCVLLGPPER